MRDIVEKGDLVDRFVRLVYLQGVVENTKVWAYCYSTDTEEVVESSKDEGCLIAKGHIPREVTALKKVFEIDQMDRFRMLVRKVEIHLA